jgi:cytochrome b561
VSWQGVLLPLAAGATLCVGVAALFCDFFEVPQPHIFNMHLLFGAAVSAVVTTCLLRARHALSQRPPQELYSYTRLVSRWTYILMYVLALVRVVLHLLQTTHSLDDFQIYVIYCIVPLWLVRALVLAFPEGKLTRRTASFQNAVLK